MLKHACIVLCLVRLSFAIEKGSITTEMVIDNLDYESNSEIQQVWRGVQSESPNVVKIVRHGYGLKSKVRSVPIKSELR